MRHKNYYLLYIKQIIISLLIYSVNSSAFFDGNNSINIESHLGATLDLNQNTANYSGDVKIQYGKSLLTADNIKLYHDKSAKIIRIVATGTQKPVQIKLVDNEKDSITFIGKAYNLDYNLSSNKLVLEDRAEVNFLSNKIRSNKIYYNHQTKIIEASPSINNPQSKVQIIIDTNKTK